jgi:transposase
MKAVDMRSLSHEARFDRRVQVIQLRHAGHSYEHIALQTGLSRTGVFDICKRHEAVGQLALHDAPSGRKTGDGRTLSPLQEALLRRLIVGRTPDALAMPEALWTHAAVSRLIAQRLGICLPVRTPCGWPNMSTRSRRSTCRGRARSARPIWACR